MTGVQGAKAGVAASETEKVLQNNGQVGRVNIPRTVRTIMGDTATGGHKLLRRVNNASRIKESANVGAEGSAYVLGRGNSVADYTIVFEADTYGPNSELFAVSHGEEGGVQVGDEIMKSREFADYLSEEINNELSDYKQITLVICRSAEGPESVGAAVSELAGRETVVRAFRGDIVANQSEFTDYLIEGTTLEQLIVDNPSMLNFDFYYNPDQIVTLGPV